MVSKVFTVQGSELILNFHNEVAIIIDDLLLCQKKSLEVIITFSTAKS